MSATSADEAVKYIAWHWRELGYAPSYRKIAKAIGIRSTSTIHVILGNLEKMGRVQRDDKGGNVRLVNDGNPDFCLHDWRVEAPVPEGYRVLCLYCNRRTEVVHHVNPNNPETWLRYAGEA